MVMTIEKNQPKINQRKECKMKEKKKKGQIETVCVAASVFYFPLTIKVHCRRILLQMFSRSAILQCLIIMFIIFYCH